MQELRGNFDIDVRILGIMSSSRMLLSESSINLASWKQQFQECAPELALAPRASHISELRQHHAAASMLAKMMR